MELFGLLSPGDRASLLYPLKVIPGEGFWIPDCIRNKGLIAAIIFVMFVIVFVAIPVLL